MYSPYYILYLINYNVFPDRTLTVIGEAMYILFTVITQNKCCARHIVDTQYLLNKGNE